jgi:hypothetical protein
MRNSILRPLALALLLAAASSATAAPTLEVTADRNHVYLHESFLLSVRVEEADEDVGEARFDASGDATFESLGSSSQSHYFVQSVNGRTTRHERLARVLTYRVTPKSIGAFTVRRVSVTVRGQAVQSRGPTVQVIGVEPQPYVRVELTASRDAVLVDEPFDITLAVTAKRLPPPNDMHDPFGPSPPPKLEIPYLAQPVPKGLRGPETQTVLEPLLAGTRDPFGFSINGVTLRDDFFGMPFGFGAMNGPTVARFKLRREEAQLDGAAAWRYTLIVSYSPEREGTFSFGPGQLKGQVITGVQPGGVPALRDVFVVGPAVTVRVTEPPMEGRPATFVGTLGTGLVAKAQLDAQTCKQGDPLQLTLDLTGAISLANLRAPVLSLVPEIAQSFRIYDDAVRSEAIDGGRRFVYTARPLSAGTIEFPPIPVSFYDTLLRAYRTVATDPIPLRVEAVAQFDPASIIGTSPEAPEMTTSIRVESARTTPAAITVASDGAVAPGRLGPMLAAWLLPGPALAGFSLVVRWIVRHRRRWARERRRRLAARRAVRRLRRARTAAEAFRAAAGFFVDRFDATEAGFSPLDAEEILRNHQYPDDDVAQFSAILQPLFDQSFRPDVPDPDLLRQARNSLPGLLARCEKPHRNTAVGGMIALLLLACGALTARAADEHRFLWNQANARMATAASPSDFAEAASIYRDLLDRGVRNGPVYRNYGTALLLADAPDAAVDALLRAERHGGTSTDLRRNLELALAARTLPAAGDTAATPVRTGGLSWTRIPLFWHYQLPLHLRIRVLLVLHNSLWLALVLRVVRLRAAARGLAVASLAGLVLFGSSVLVSLHQDATPLPEPVYRWGADTEKSP